MEPITTAIAAVTAASNAIGFIKARINDVQSVADISDQIGTLFSAQKKLNEERNKQAGVGDINIRSSIDAVLEAKKLNEQMQEIATMINLRQQEMAETIKTCAIIFGVLLVAIFLFAVMFMTIARSVEGERYDYSRTVFSLENTASLHDVG